MTHRRRMMNWMAIGLMVLVRVAGADYVRDIKPLLKTHCVKCHGETQQKGRLRLDTGRAAIAGGEHGPAIVPGNPNTSLLLKTLAGEHDEISRMPYKRPPLDASEILRLRRWIADGAGFPADEAPSSDRHWAFEVPVRPEIPRLAVGMDAGENPIDAFVRARLTMEKVEPSPEADREVLLRRMMLDLTGLPPTPEERAAFLADTRPGAYERWVDRLLASPHFGERQGRIWLDLARYADSNGYSIDSPRSMWPYRDWVVEALNHDLPFDTFSVWQLAGDLLTGHPAELTDKREPSPRATLSPEESARWLGPWDAGSPRPAQRWAPLIASGFHRNTQVNHEGGIDPEQFRIESAMDRVNTTATVWMGLTLACAQCHDHKFDPLGQRDYYRMFAYFNSSENDGHGHPGLIAEHALDLTGATEREHRAAHRKTVERMESELRAWLKSELQPRQGEWEASIPKDDFKKLPQLTRELLGITPPQRSTEQSNVVWAAYRDSNPEYQQRRKALEAFRKHEPQAASSLVMVEKAEPRPTVVFIKGDFTRPGDPVAPGTPEVFGAMRSSTKDQRPLRLDLARWLVSAGNPLLTRVLANRIWQQYFGRGLVETENDFGTQGLPPSHPELLDWLATELRATGTPADPSDLRLKRIHRLIVTSGTYRQSSKNRADLMERDPRNLWLARQNRLRLDAELIRDSALVTSGLLDRRLGGPPVFPPQPAGLGAFTQNSREWKTSGGGNRHRRGIYTHLQRTTLHPALAVFDSSDAFTTCTRRLRSNTPLQALTLLNDPAFHELAEAFGKGLESSPGTIDARLDMAFVRALGRQPRSEELDRLRAVISTPEPKTADWIQVARVMLNLDERVTRE